MKHLRALLIAAAVAGGALLPSVAAAQHPVCASLPPDVRAALDFCGGTPAPNPTRP